MLAVVTGTGNVQRTNATTRLTHQNGIVDITQRLIAKIVSTALGRVVEKTQKLNVTSKSNCRQRQSIKKSLRYE